MTHTNKGWKRLAPIIPNSFINGGWVAKFYCSCSDSTSSSVHWMFPGPEPQITNHYIFFSCVWMCGVNSLFKWCLPSTYKWLRPRLVDRHTLGSTELASTTAMDDEGGLGIDPGFGPALQTQNYPTWSFFMIPFDLNWFGLNSFLNMKFG